MARRVKRPRSGLSWAAQKRAATNKRRIKIFSTKANLNPIDARTGAPNITSIGTASI